MTKIKSKILICCIFLLSLASLVNADGMYAYANATNATGWSELYEGNLIQASWAMYTAAWGSWVFTILFMVFQFMLLNKTKSPLLALFTTSLVIGVSYAKDLIEGLALGFLMIYTLVLIVWILLTLIKKDSTAI